MNRLQAVGECLVELRRLDAHTLRMGYAGDTYNTAVYFARVCRELGVPWTAEYLTGLGDDELSRQMRAAWAVEGVADRSVTVAGRAPGMYMIDVDAHGERSFSYWRDGSAARTLFDDARWVDAIDGDVVYLSGITLQLTAGPARTALMDKLDEVRARGARVAFDTNYRRQGWRSPKEAAAALDAAVSRADVVFASLDDESALHGELTAGQAARRLAALTAGEVLVKAGAHGALVAQGGDVHAVAAVPVEAVDTTAAGDSFAAGYLAGRVHGLAPVPATGLACRVAAVVVGHPGALAPRGARLAGGPPDAPRTGLLLAAERSDGRRAR